MNTSELPRLVLEEYRAALADAMELYEITTPKRVTAFIAQIAHESARFTRMVESLNYSPHRLLQVVPKHFLPAEAVQFAHDERRIANRVYGGRMGNGTEATGDGYRFRGRGFIMLTGRADKELVQRAQQFGVNNYVTKPFSPAQLRQKIQEVFGPLT